MTGHSRRSFCNGNLSSRYNSTYNYGVELVTTRCDYIKIVAFAGDFSAARKLRSPFQLIMDSITWNRTKIWLLSLAHKIVAHHKVWSTCTCKRTFQKYQSKDNKFWQKVSRFSYRYSNIQEAVCWWNTITMDLWKVLSQITRVEPQAACCCFTTGFNTKLLAYSQHKWRLEKFRWCN